MLDRADATFATHLERDIIKTLSGDDVTPGLYRTVLGSQDWEAFLTTKGQIQAYEAVLEKMRAVARKMNGDEKSMRQSDRSMN